MVSLLDSSIIRITGLIILTTILYQYPGYAQTSGIGYNGYSSEVENLTVKVTASEDNIRVFEDYEVKLIVPDAWREVDPVSARYYVTPFNYREFFTIKSRLKLMNDRGDQVWIWWEEYDSDNPDDDENLVEEVMDFAPIHRHIKTVTFKGKKRPYVKLHIWKAYHIYEGKRVPFKVFAGYRTSPTFKPLLGKVYMFGVSASADLNGVTENDILKMAELLAVHQKTEQEAGGENSKQESGLSKEKEGEIVDKEADKESGDHTGDKKDSEQSYAWMVPSLKKDWHISLERTELVAPNLLFIGYNSANAVINTGTHEIAWYEQQDSPVNAPHFVLGNRDKVITCRKVNANIHSIEAHNTLTGEILWSTNVTQFENPPDNWLYNDSTNSLIVISKNTDGIRLDAIDWETGESKWETSYKPDGKLPEPPLSFYTTNQFIYFDKNVNAVSLIDGKEIWHNDEIKLDKENLLQEYSSDTLFILDKNQNLNCLDGKTGEIFNQVKLTDTVIYRNISLSDNYVFLRGSVEEKDEQAIHNIQAFDKTTGDMAWIYSDPVISLSNILEGDDKVYFATWQDVISLNKSTGDIHFRTRLAHVGKTYPVMLRKYNDTIVYVGEMTIAGIDASDGTIIYKKDFNPMSQEMNLDAIDTLCEEHYEYLRHLGKVGMSENAAKAFSEGFSFTMSTNAQERASKLYTLSRQKYSSGDYFKSEILYNQSRISSAFARSMAVAEQFTSIFNNAVRSVDNYVRKDRDRYEDLLGRRESIMETYDNQLFGDYAIKVSEEGDDGGIGYTRMSIVYLPTGNVVYTRRKNSILETFLTFNIVNKELYFHDYLPIQEREGVSENKEEGTENHAYYLVGIPLETGTTEK